MKDPYCCLGDKLRAGIEGFDRGALTTYRSLRHVVRRLSREEALELIDEMIVELEAKSEALGGRPATPAGGAVVVGQDL